MSFKYPFSNYLKKKSCAIYLFHGVVNKKNNGIRNYTHKHIHVKKFRKIINDLKNKGQAISMNDVVNFSNNRENFPDNSYAITFDDGYYNNYAIAAPILDKISIPATFYITTDFVSNNSMSWIDIIEESINNLHYSKGIKYKNLNIKRFNKNNKIIFLNFLRKNIKRNNNINPYEEINNISKLNNFNLISSLNNIFDKKMSWKDLNILSKNKNFIIGGHGKTHQILSYLGEKNLDFEISNSIKLIKSKLKKQVLHYSYPEGLNFCYGKREINILKYHGIVCSPSAEEGVNKTGESLFDLKRIFCK